ncbi:MAG: MBL fold metallo-hydrolase [Verrucomicrobiota bacterium]|nr:MBL fold metallo-hydrolase [Verrucomicrobiota bacterium]
MREVAVQFTILGSGSGGNCAYLETEDTRILIDAGFSGKQIRERMTGIGRGPETLDGILITHEHSDHIQGLAGLCSRQRLTVYCNRLTREAIELEFKGRDSVPNIDFRLFSTGSTFEIGSVSIETFSVPHDAYDPVGFMIQTGGVNIGFLTDLGHATKLVLERVRRSHVLLVETNHDPQMLADDPRRPWSLKQRILSRHGHLSNQAAAEAVQEVMSADLRHLYLAHLSRDCNTPELAYAAVQGRIQQMGASHVAVHTTSQESACATLSL